MDANDPDGTAFAVVCDVAATWDDYRLLRRALDGETLAALLLHAAGPTDEGFRTIDVWASERDWHLHRVAVAHAFDHLAMPPVVRELHVSHLLSPPTTPRTPRRSP